MQAARRLDHDAVGEKRAQNQPGTNNEYPNWRIPLADAKGNVYRSKPSSTPPVPNASPNLQFLTRFTSL